MPDTNAPLMGHNAAPDTASLDPSLATATRLLGLYEKLGETDITEDNAPEVVTMVKQITLLTNQLDTDRKAADAEWKKSIPQAIVDAVKALKKLVVAKEDAKALLAGYMVATNQTIITNDYGNSAKLQNDLVFVIAEPDKIPRKFLKVDEGAVKKALKEGQDVPGAYLDEQKTVVVR